VLVVVLFLKLLGLCKVEANETQVWYHVRGFIYINEIGSWELLNSKKGLNSAPKKCSNHLGSDEDMRVQVFLRDSS
jgi:hypothetical protein